MSDIYCHECLRIYGRIDLAPFTSKEDYRRHVEKIHHIVYPKENETNRDARARFLAENPDVTDITKCDCARCLSKKRHAAQLGAWVNS